MSPQRSLFWVSFAFLLGIALAGAISLPVSIWLILAAAAIALGILWRFLAHSIELTELAGNVVSIAIFLVFLSLGAARYQYQKETRVFDAFDLGWYNDREYDTLITAWVTEPPDYRDHYANLLLRAISIDTGGGDDLQVDGLLLARVDPNEDYHYGQIVRLRGKLETPPESEEFSYREYLARQNVHSMMSSAEATILPGQKGNFFMAGMFALQARALETIYRIFPDPEASLLAGILLGVDSGLPKDLQQAFKDTGTSHIIAISGFNIAIIAELFLSLFGRVFGQRRGAFFAGIGIVFYTLLVGADAAVVRAAVMGVTALLARHFGRQQDGLRTLFGVAALMNLFNPYYIQDVGFQLSFSATLGLILFSQSFTEGVRGFLYNSLPLPAARKLTKPFPKNLFLFLKRQFSPALAEKTMKPISDYFLLTLAAQATTLPIMAYHFGRLSLVSFIANPFILPAQPAVMILGGLADLLGMIFEPLGQIAAYIAWPFVAYTIRTVDWFGSVSWASISWNFPFWGVLAWYIALLGLTFGRPLLKELMQRLPKIPAWVASAGLILLALFIWRAALSLPDGKLRVTFLDVGASDAILIETPSGGTALINGGESLSKLSSQLGQRLPLYDRKLDWLIVASTQENQVNALPRLMDRYPASQALWAGNVEASFPSRKLNEWLVGHQVRVTRAEAGQALDLGDGAVLRVLHADERGAVLLVEYGSFRVLLPVGMNFDALDSLSADESLHPLTALLLADSGYAPLNPESWIAFLDPQLVVISVSADNPLGLPGQETLDAVGARSLLRTDVNGWIELASDGTSIWVEAERGEAIVAATPTPVFTETPAAEEPLLTEEPTEEPTASP